MGVETRRREVVTSSTAEGTHSTSLVSSSSTRWSDGGDRGSGRDSAVLEAFLSIGRDRVHRWILRYVLALI